jgi:hypothetical protein
MGEGAVVGVGSSVEVEVGVEVREDVDMAVGEDRVETAEDGAVAGSAKAVGVAPHDISRTVIRVS